MKIKNVITVIVMAVVLSTLVSFQVKADEEIVTVVNEAVVPAEDEDKVTVEDKEDKKDKKEKVTDTKKVANVSVAAATKKVTTKKTSKKSYTKAELRLMTAIIYCEAGNQSYAGKKAVGIVVMNRKSSKKFPNTIKSVLYQKMQFQPTRNGMMTKALKMYDKGTFKKAPYKDCLKAAKQVLSGDKTVKIGKKTHNLKGYYFFSRYVKGCRLKIGAHMFK